MTITHCATNQGPKKRKCLIVGAGISGLSAARYLLQRGISVTVLDKARGVGGRMATRRIGTAIYDHGAQFFTVRDSQFEVLVDIALQNNVVTEWCKGFVNSFGETKSDGHSRYRGTNGMTSFPKFLADSIPVHISSQVISIREEIGRWRVATKAGSRYDADALLLTSPVPQSLSLIDAGKIELDMNVRTALLQIRYDPCITMMLQPTENRIPVPGGIQFTHGPISFISDNHQKGISPEQAVTVHASAEFSLTHWETSDEEAAALLAKECGQWISLPSEPPVIHRWKFAKPSVLHNARTIITQTPLPLAFAGDAFFEPRVEGAYLSGLEAGMALADLMDQQE